MRVELHAHSCFSFLDGASQPQELAERAAELGYEALALTDHDGLAGSLEFAHAARAGGLRPITGAELTLVGGAHLTLLVESPAGYRNLCRLITLAHADDRRAPAAALEQVLHHADGLHCLSGCARDGAVARLVAAGRLREAEALALRLRAAFGRARFSIELQRPYWRGDARRNRLLGELADRLGVRTVATGDTHAHSPRRALLQDALVAIRLNTTLEACEAARRGNHEAVLVPPAELDARFPAEAVRGAAEVAARCRFDLTCDLGYRYPDFSDSGEPAQVVLARLCRDELERRYAGSRLLREARARLGEELDLIAHHRLAGFFLLHREILEMARDVAARVRGASHGRRLLPPGRGRGSSVGSIVCYLIGLSHVDPVEARLFLGRFLSRDLTSVPDIDLDFPRDIREGLMVDVVERYGADHAALVAAFPTYRTRGAIRDLGKALALPQGEVERMARLADAWGEMDPDQIDELRGRLDSPRWRAFRFLMEEIRGLPRHLSQHSGGMVISTTPLVELVPVVPAAMEGRQICQWDKDSCADAGFLKIDLLGLGMLSAVEECVDLIAESRGSPIDLSRVGFDDPDVYAEIQDANTVGVFQIESRAQMQSLVQTRPATLDDLTVQVALVRPGPIVGDAVNPYIKTRRMRRDDPDYPVVFDHPLLEPVLADTLGVVVFQDQVLEVAIALAGFSTGEADGLRRAMSRKRSREALEGHWRRFREGAAGNGVDEETARRVFDKVVAFSEFGFPKSHAAAFAILAYQSAWLHRAYPGEFLCALLNAQPMGFYPPATLLRDGERRGVEVRPPDINDSRATCTVEDAGAAVRIGLGFVKGVGTRAEGLVAERDRGGPFRDLGDLVRRSTVDAGQLEALVRAGACAPLGDRRLLLWELGLHRAPSGSAEARQLALPLDAAPTPALRPMTEWERMVADHEAMGLTTGPHPIPHGGIAARRGGRPGHGGRGDGGPPAPVDRARHRLPARRGRDGHGERDRPRPGVRAPPGRHPSRAAGAGVGPAGAPQRHPERDRRPRRGPLPRRPARDHPPGRARGRSGRRDGSRPGRARGGSAGPAGGRAAAEQLRAGAAVTGGAPVTAAPPGRIRQQAGSFCPQNLPVYRLWVYIHPAPRLSRSIA
jgi:error-prone DNA polymerase